MLLCPSGGVENFGWLQPPSLLKSCVCPCSPLLSVMPQDLHFYTWGETVFLLPSGAILPLRKIFLPPPLSLKMEAVPDEKNPRHASDMAPNYKNSYFLPKKMFFLFLTKINKNPQEKNIAHCYKNVSSPVLVCSCQLEIHCERRRVCYTQPSPHQPL